MAAMRAAARQGARLSQAIRGRAPKQRPRIHAQLCQVSAVAREENVLRVPGREAGQASFQGGDAADSCAGRGYFVVFPARWRAGEARAARAASTAWSGYQSVSQTPRQVA